jgi:D-methionine transport system substrate-binding protein
MKKLLAALAAVVALGVHADEVLTVGASAVPHAEILEFVKPMLAKEGVDLQIKVFSDYIQPNVQLADKTLDANFFQHQPALNEFNKSNGTDLVAVTKVHVEPVGAYSNGILKNIDDLPEGANVALPNEPANEGRALLLLAKNGLITLKDPNNILSKPQDIAENPKNLKFRALEAATLPRVVTQVDLTLLNTNYAMSVKLDPTKDALFIEGSDSPYVNILVARQENRDSIAMQKLVVALHSPELKQFILDKYQGAIVPAF